jgi:hypothetical protein
MALNGHIYAEIIGNCPFIQRPADVSKNCSLSSKSGKKGTIFELSELSRRFRARHCRVLLQ